MSLGLPPAVTRTHLVLILEDHDVRLALRTAVGVRGATWASDVPGAVASNSHCGTRALRRATELCSLHVLKRIFHVKYKIDST